MLCVAVGVGPVVVAVVVCLVGLSFVCSVRWFVSDSAAAAAAAAVLLLLLLLSSSSSSSSFLLFVFICRVCVFHVLFVERFYVLTHSR